MYRVEVDWAPAYELLVSLHAYLSPADRKIMDLGAAWVKHVRQHLRPDVAAELAALMDERPADGRDLLVWLCPGERDAAGFLRWLDGLSPGDLYECLAPYLRDDAEFRFRDLATGLKRQVQLLAMWNEHYFSRIDPAILDGLAADAAARRALTATMSADALVEEATSGIDFAARPDVETVLLIPQYHYRPWNLYDAYRGLQIFEYPVDALPPAPGEPPPDLLRLTRALADESRLRILRFLAAGPHTFTDVVGFTGLAKSTVHHHLVALRAAGLVRVHHTGEAMASYSLRASSVAELSRRLGSFLHGD